MKTGCNTNALSNTGRDSAIVIAIMNGNEEEIHILGQAGANFNVAIKEDLTPLQLAFNLLSPIPIIEALVVHGADIFVRSAADDTLLMFACKNSSLLTIQFLVEKGAGLNDFNNLLQSPLMFALSANRTDNKILINYLIKNGSNVNNLDEQLNNALMYVSREPGSKQTHEDITACIYSLIKNGVNVDDVNIDNW